MLVKLVSIIDRKTYNTIKDYSNVSDSPILNFVRYQRGVSLGLEKTIKFSNVFFNFNFYVNKNEVEKLKKILENLKVVYNENDCIQCNLREKDIRRILKYRNFKIKGKNNTMNRIIANHIHYELKRCIPEMSHHNWRGAD